MLRATSLLCAAGLLLAACGNTAGERGVTGAGIGAAAGAVVGAVTGLTVVQAALIGAGAGGLTGALTDKSQINIGDPVWKQSSASAQPAGSGTARSGLVRDIQAKLSRQGIDPGPSDGRLGPKTRAAITQYQQRNNLFVDGNASPALLAHMQQNG